MIFFLFLVLLTNRDALKYQANVAKIFITKTDSVNCNKMQIVNETVSHTCHILKDLQLPETKVLRPSDSGCEDFCL